MALISKASLLMVPSTYEAGKLYNVLPSGNRAPDNKGGAGYDQTRADFDFDRGSNAAATRINSSGLIEKYRENVLLQSNAFSASPWSLSSATISGGQSGYDGSNDAWIFTTSVSGAALARSFSETGIVTFSVYAKAGSVNGIRLRIDTNSDANGFFDLVNGTSTSSGDIDTNIENIGSGWYRCSVSHNAVGPVKLQFFTTDGTSSYDNGSILIQSAQLETGLVATDYLNSTSVTAKAGVLIDLPRINYDANGENGALLLEPQRVNSIGNTELINPTIDSNWKQLGSNTFTTNYGISPDGFKNSTLIEFGGTNSAYQAYYQMNFSAGDYTTSIWAKGSGSFKLGIYDNSSILNDTITLTSEWQRFEVTKTAATTTNGRGVWIYPNGDGDTIEVWGAQCEAGSYATSYIPNHSGTGGVTRAADSCSVTGASDVIGQTEGTMFVEAETLENGADCRITISDNTINNRVSIEWDILANTLKGFIGTAGNLATSNYNQTNRNKIAIVYNSADARFFINGTKVSTDTTISILSGMNRVDFSNYGGALPFVGKVYKMYMSEEKLTDAEAITLTTL